MLLSRSGDKFCIQASTAPIKREDGTARGTVLVFHDVSEQCRLPGEMSVRPGADRAGAGGRLALRARPAESSWDNT